MTSQAKKLISNLKKEIEEINKKETITQTDLSNYNFKKSQLQFAEKLMKLRDKEEEERLKKLIEKIKKGVEDWFKNKNTGYWVTINEHDIEELNKILDEIK